MKQVKKYACRVEGFDQSEYVRLGDLVSGGVVEFNGDEYKLVPHEAAKIRQEAWGKSMDPLRCIERWFYREIEEVSKSDSFSDAGVKTRVNAMRNFAHNIENTCLRIATTEDQLARAIEKVAELERLVYVPGVWRCAKCELRLFTSTLDANTGQIAANQSPQRCPNECGPMWRITERDSGNKLIDQMDTMQAELAAANDEKDKAAQLRTRVSALEQLLEGWRDRAYKAPEVIDELHALTVRTIEAGLALK